MGIIEEGSISGVLPSCSETFAVHYPGYPSSTERAIETLGGSQGILKVRTDKLNKLELHFRPEDPYSHPAFGELQPCNNFLLKISRKKVKDIPEHASEDSFHLKQNTESTETAEHNQPEGESFSASEVKGQTDSVAQEQLSADIMARVSEAYHFNGMVDYQHVLAVHADVNRRKKRNWAEVEPQFEKGGLMDVDQEDLMILVPPLFSIKDLPEKVVLKTSGDLSLRKKQEGVFQHQWEDLNSFLLQWLLLLDLTFLQIPKKVNWEKSIPRNSDRWQWQMAVCELFEERPIWLKHSLAEHLLDRGLNVGNKMLKRLLFIAAYYFSNGPYLRFWIRKGYDPRKDPESRIYQRTDFRFHHPYEAIVTHMRYLVFVFFMWEDICAFRVFPCKTQISLQLFELKDDYIQQEIRKPTSQGSCSLQTGWFSLHVIDCLRLRVAQRFLSVYPESGAESLLKSVSHRFEKSKRMQLNVKDLKVHSDGKQADKEVLESEDKETNDEVEYEEDEEDEMEDDNLGDDVDADEALNLVDEDRNFPLQDSCILAAYSSLTSVLDLFGSFPFGAAGGNEMLDTDPQDDGYQIYEQYSDGDYSDDEDY
ncbi:General transcription factor 3C polypeptide 5 [Sesamum angolense]|uniref:General transcription factor 3C polypeptide 5 n=1 Tax=Sesamum angolense TaxID=2727404 RepID=A0AAE2BPB0_9LAMI|nr:General transcription factor 3C polypeptide 5 [Sesamum angolense]